MTEHEHCHELLGSLSEYIDGTLEADICSEIEHHLVGCENCRIVIDTLKKTVYLVRANASQVELPVDVRERLFQRLNLEEFNR